jgi:hypothetical protein
VQHFRLFRQGLLEQNAQAVCEQTYLLDFGVHRIQRREQGAFLTIGIKHMIKCQDAEQIAKGGLGSAVRHGTIIQSGCQTLDGTGNACAGQKCRSIRQSRSIRDNEATKIGEVRARKGDGGLSRNSFGDEHRELLCCAKPCRSGQGSMPVFSSHQLSAWFASLLPGLNLMARQKRCVTRSTFIPGDLKRLKSEAKRTAWRGFSSFRKEVSNHNPNICSGTNVRLAQECHSGAILHIGLCGRSRRRSSS